MIFEKIIITRNDDTIHSVLGPFIGEQFIQIIQSPFSSKIGDNKYPKCITFEAGNVGITVGMDDIKNIWDETQNKLTLVAQFPFHCEDGQLIFR